MRHQKIIIKEQHLLLISEKAIYWVEEKCLILSDTHYGKAGTFQQGGIPVSSDITYHDLKRLEKLISTYQPTEVFFLGDLFHSHENTEWRILSDWLKKNKNVVFRLIPGNHDILPKELYEQSRLLLEDKNYIRKPFLFTHHPSENIHSDGSVFSISGHIHPGFQLSGLGRQQVTLPCFVVTENSIILPAFGRFTGLHRIQREKEDIFVVADDEVIQV